MHIYVPFWPLVYHIFWCPVSWGKGYNYIKVYNLNHFPQGSANTLLFGHELWLFLTDKISSFAQFPKECCEAFGLLLKPCLSKEVSMKPEKISDPAKSSHVFSHSEIVMENYNTDVNIGSFFWHPMPTKQQNKTRTRK